MRLESPPEWTFGPLTRTDIVRYQGASGDFNPIHHDDAVARSVGYPTAFAPGMLPAGLLAGFATRWLGAANLRSLRFRFHEKVWPGDVLVLSGSVVGVADDGAEVTVRVECARADAGVAVTGSAVFAMDPS